MWLAYIDPGTGSMLFTILIGVISAGVYALRNSIVKLRFFLSGGRQEKGGNESAQFVIFAESKRYWNVFESICDEFERRKVPVSYFTASPDDPSLEKPYEHVKCEFIGEGNKAFARMNMLKADVVLATTPGLDVYQWKRSRDVKWYAHLTHSIGDMTMYRMFGIDYYDAILLVADWQIRQVRELEAIRKLPEKELPIVGSTPMDYLAARLEASAPIDDHQTTILLAPSWGESAILSLYGAKMIEALLATGYHVVIRPHPQSFVSEKDMMDALMAAFPESDQLEWNRENDNFEVLRRSDIMISDFSNVVIDYSFTFGRPIIYTEPNVDKAPYDACWVDEEIWIYRTLPRIGRQLDGDRLDGIKELVDSCLNDEELRASIERARTEDWRYHGKAAVHTVDYLVAKQRELSEESDEASAVQ